MSRKKGGRSTSPSAPPSTRSPKEPSQKKKTSSRARLAARDIELEQRDRRKKKQKHRESELASIAKVSAAQQRQVREIEAELQRLRRRGSRRAELDIHAEQEKIGISFNNGRIEHFSLSDLEGDDANTAMPTRRELQEVNIEKTAIDIESRLHLIDDLTHLTFIATFSPDKCVKLIRRCVPENMSDPARFLVDKIARLRIKNLCSTWKCALLKKMKSWIQGVFVSNAWLRDEVKNLNDLRQAFGAMYNMSHFKKVFSFSRRDIDLSRSSVHAKLWAQHVFCNLAAYTKLIMDIDAKRWTPSATKGKNFTPKLARTYLYRIHGDAPIHKRPEPNDFYFNDMVRMKRRLANEDAQVADSDDDDLFGEIYPPPGVDIHEDGEGMFDELMRN